MADKHDTDESRAKLMDAALSILKDRVDPAKVTTRMIAAKAGVGIGLINYHFGSKDNLLNEAVSRDMAIIANGITSNNQNLDNPREGLIDLLKQTSKTAADNPELTKIPIYHELIKGRPNTADYLLPYLKKIFGTSKTETELKALAYVLISALQIIFLRSDIFKEYTGIDILDDAQRNVAIEMLVNNIIRIPEREIGYEKQEDIYLY
ncbi:MAG: TetR/AcrR family transcriptional regulator [Acidobacteria bacterium]|nr:TetR/AcrR family transcriptional regulator [Acidobacteriota bacterium]